MNKVYKLINPDYENRTHEGYHSIDLTNTVESLSGWTHMIPVTPEMKVERLLKWFKTLPDPVKEQNLHLVNQMRDAILMLSPLGVKACINHLKEQGVTAPSIALLEEVCYNDYQDAVHYQQ